MLLRAFPPRCGRVFVVMIEGLKSTMWIEGMEVKEKKSCQVDVSDEGDP